MEENKYLLEVETTWQFPIIKYTTNASYVEVRKASGIAYILLQLFSNVENGSEKLASTLKSFGVPNDIHHIFASELSAMLSFGIIKMNSTDYFSVDLFDTYRISEFEITMLGQKLFKEGTIPTGKNRVKKIDTFFDISQKNIKLKSEVKTFKLENSALDETCIGNILLNNSDVENFINDNIKYYSFKKGEHISSFEHEEPEILVYRLEDAVSLKLSKEGITLKAKDKNRDEFIHNFYSVHIISTILGAKKKYRFSEEISKELKEYDFHSMKLIDKVFMPSQINNACNIKCTMALPYNHKIKNAEYSISKNDSIELMKKCNIDGIACYFDNKNLFSIIPGRFFINVQGYSEKCGINLIVVEQQSNDLRQRLLTEIFLRCLEGEKPLNNYMAIIKLTEITGCKDYYEQFCKSLMGKIDSLMERIDLFIELNNKFEEQEEWNSCSVKYAETLLNDLCKEITVDSFSVKNKMGEKLNQIVRLDDIEYLLKISEELTQEKDEITVFEALEKEKFDIEIILERVNIFDLYCKNVINNQPIRGNSNFSRQFVLLEDAFSKLREITGIKDPTRDSVNMDFNLDKFNQAMVTFLDSMIKIDKYKRFSKDEYGVLCLFKERFIEIKEVATIEKEAINNPKKINADYIEEKIKKAKYKDAICDLHIRLQYELNRLNDTYDQSTYELLKSENTQKYLESSEIDKMNELRKCRNGFQHPKTERGIQYSENIIREWCVIVEKLGGIINEPCCQD